MPVTGSSPAGSVVARTRILTRSPTHPTSKEAALTPQSTPAVETSGLVKRFRTTRAVDRVDLQMPIGSVYGLLGPNGAGKTTVIRMLATLLRPDAGTARGFGHAVVAEADAVRRRVSLTGQYAAVDDDLTGRENLVLLARLLGFSRPTLWINDVAVGTWTSPGDYGDRRGIYTPTWWKLEGSQYGKLKTWRIGELRPMISPNRLDRACRF